MSKTTIAVALSLLASACGGQIGEAAHVVDAGDLVPDGGSEAGMVMDAGAPNDSGMEIAECDANVVENPFRDCRVGEMCRLDTASCGWMAECIDAGWLAKCVDPCPPIGGDPPAQGSACRTRGLACRFGPLVAYDETDCTCEDADGGLTWLCVSSPDH